jgi:predicted Zn-dependent protease
LLTELNSEAELAAVLGHEIVHAAAKHSAQQMSRGVILQTAVLATAMVTGDNSFGQFAVGSAAVGAQLLNSTYGRGAELESDKYGMTYMSRAGYDPGGAVTLQETFVRLSEGQDSDWLSGLFASHPPSRARVDANIKTAASLPSGGELGVERYQAAMKKTMAVKPAYDAYDEGRKALADEKSDEALALAEKAIELYPDEGHFYALRGDVRLVDRKYDMATKNYDSAIQRRDDYFYYYLRRGLAEKELGDTTAAKADLERSIEMLRDRRQERRGDRPGGDAQTAAVAAAPKPRGGHTAPLRCGQRRQPRGVGQEHDALGYRRRAGRGLVYRRGRPHPDRHAAGRTQTVRQSITGRIAPDAIASVNTGLGPYTGSSCPAEVVAARYAE